MLWECVGEDGFRVPCNFSITRATKTEMTSDEFVVVVTNVSSLVNVAWRRLCPISTIEEVGGSGRVGVVGRDVRVAFVDARDAMVDWSEGKPSNASVGYGCGRVGNSTEILSGVCVQRAEVPTGIRLSGVDNNDLSHS